MDLNQLKELGGFYSPEPVKRNITWVPEEGAEPVVFAVHIRHLSYGVIESLGGVDPDNPDRSFTAALISRAVLLGENANQEMTYQDAYQLKPTLALTLRTEIYAVNGLGDSAAKKH